MTDESLGNWVMIISVMVFVRLAVPLLWQGVEHIEHVVRTRFKR